MTRKQDMRRQADEGGIQALRGSAGHGCVSFRADKLVMYAHIEYMYVYIYIYAHTQF